jgi:hypothetical protein
MWCVECIITWIIVPTAVSFGIYHWIVRKCYKHYKTICEKYEEIQKDYERMVTSFKNINDKINDVSEWGTFFTKEGRGLLYRLEDRVGILEEKREQNIGQEQSEILGDH